VVGSSALSWADERDLKPGHVVGPFELVALVGRGGMARVWAAREQQSGQFYALKMLRSHLAEDTNFRDMFFDEARIASLTQHENVAHTYELLELDGILCLVMELVEGPSLVRIIRPGSAERDDAKRVPIPPRLAARIVAEASAGLHAAHELRDESGRPLGGVHRDVSPQKVLLSVDGHVKVTDFGVAKALNKINVTLAGQIKGKLAYMSPEQLGGSGIDRRSDVFALGSLLYELTVGQRAFDGESDPEVMRAILIGEPIPPSQIVRGYPPALDQIIMRAIASDPAQRWPTARHMQEALEGYIAQSGPPVTPADLAALVHERTGVPASGATPISGPHPHQGTPVMGASPPQLAVPQHAVASGTRRREEAPKGTSWTTIILAMLTGLVFGLIVLRSVYVARKTHTMSTPADAPSASARPAATPVVPISTLVVAPTAPTPTPGVDLLELPATPRPSAAPKAPKPAAPALPPNPYE
jgi:serine/threonine-protein kinase